MLSLPADTFATRRTWAFIPPAHTNYGTSPTPPFGDQDIPLRFDRILADVPCSGDGTLRKAPDIWRRWNVGTGNGLHLMQLRIALQCCRLLKVT